MKTALVFLLLALPIVCLLGGAVYCAVCLWKAHQENVRVERTDAFRLQQDMKVGSVMFHCEDEDEDDNSFILACCDLNKGIRISYAKSCEAVHLLNKVQMDKAKRRKAVRYATSHCAKKESFKKIERVLLLKLNKSNWILLVCECLLYVLPIVLVPIISGEQIAEYDITLNECILSLAGAVCAIGANLLISVINPSEILSWLGTNHTFFFKGFLVIILPVLLLGAIFAALCVYFFSQDITYWFSSMGNIVLLSCATISFLLIGNAALSYTRKMLEYAEQG